MNKTTKIALDGNPIVTLKDMSDVKAVLYRESKDSQGEDMYTIELVMSGCKNIFLTYDSKEYRDKVADVIERVICDDNKRESRNYKAC